MDFLSVENSAQAPKVLNHFVQGCLKFLHLGDSAKKRRGSIAAPVGETSEVTYAV